MPNISETLTVFLQTLPARARVFVAYSGGVDSTVLLHALATQRESITAIHINHNLYPDADDWQKIVEKNCKNLNVTLQTVKLETKPKQGESIEAWAREQRYMVFEEKLPENSLLLTAQHADDQTETILLQLLRGSGAKGLMGMPVEKPLGKGKLIRPFLTMEKADMLAYAAEHNLSWAEDHSNENMRFDRNFLRQAIIPKLKERWPGLNKTCARTASHLSELYEQLSIRVPSVSAGSRNSQLSITVLSRYPVSEQKHLIRTWLEQKQFPMPPTTKLNEIISSVVNARPDANPEVNWENVHIRRYRDELYALTAEETLSLEGMEFEWDGQTELTLPHAAGKLKKINLPGPFTIRFRSGGEKINIPGRPTKTLKNLFQEAGIPPWERPRTPLIYKDNKLVLVALQPAEAELPIGC